jgi:hypothetical protein
MNTGDEEKPGDPGYTQPRQMVVRLTKRAGQAAQQAYGGKFKLDKATIIVEDNDGKNLVIEGTNCTVKRNFNPVSRHSDKKLKCDDVKMKTVASSPAPKPQAIKKPAARPEPLPEDE